MQEVEVCTVSKVLAKRTDVRGRLEYLVSWKEYPGEETWEGLENLRNVKNMLDEFEAKIRKQQEEVKLTLAETKKKTRLDSENSKIDRIGSWVKGDVSGSP